MAAPRLTARFVAPAALLLGVLASTAMFARSHGVRPGRRAPEDAESVAAHQDSPVAGAAMSSGRAGGVASLFQGRVRELEARVAERPEDAQTLLALAHLLHDGHRVADAVPLYRRAMGLAPEDPQPYYDLAAAHGALGEWDAAARVLLERLDDDPGDAVALYDLGAVRANQGRVQEARAMLESARAVTSDGALRARISQTLSRLKES